MKKFEFVNYLEHRRAEISVEDSEYWVYLTHCGAMEASLVVKSEEAAVSKSLTYVFEGHVEGGDI